MSSSQDLGGGTQGAATASVTSRVNYLEVPLNVVYSLGEDGQGFQLFAGPYVAFGLGGKADYNANISITNGSNVLFEQRESGNQSYTFGSTFVDPDPNGTSPNLLVLDTRVRRFDAGLNFGVGYRVGPVQAQLGYGLGLVNAQPDYPASYQEPNTKGYNRAAQLSLAYLFSSGGR